MIDVMNIDYSALDNPRVLQYLFHPRPEFDAPWQRATKAEDVLIPAGDRAKLGARFHLTGKTGPAILFFHGNGEIAADYDDLAEMYVRAGVSFIPVDYRGYGRSSGSPTVTFMMRDAHHIFSYVRAWAEKNDKSPFIVMGRSLGSASALELLASYGDKIDGAIIESGFAYTETILGILGLSTRSLGITEDEGFRNLDKIRTFGKPTLVIHAERDHILPLADGKALFEASPAQAKKFVMIRGANHNDIFLRGLGEYMAAVAELVKEAAAAKRD